MKLFYFALGLASGSLLASAIWFWMLLSTRSEDKLLAEWLERWGWRLASRARAVQRTGLKPP